MRRLELEINDSVFNTLKEFLELLPKNKIKIREIGKNFHIPYVSDEEQKEIEKILKNKSCYVISRSKTLKI